MEIVIHGTKGGRKIFTSNKPSGLFDVTSDSPKTSAIGQSAYAIRFISNSTIFSKYKIIRDVRGDKRTGFVAFSLFLSKNEKLSGDELISLLDKVSDEYCLNYVVDNNLNEVTEDWSFVERLSSEYLIKIIEVSDDDKENLQSGNLDEAFIYYNDNEIQKYFDQSERLKKNNFLTHRQIFFVSKTLKNLPENPLNALRNSGVDFTGKIDLENPPLILRDFTGLGNNGTTITIKKADGTILKKGCEILRNDLLTVIYSKKNYVHEPVVGTMNDDNIKEYLKIRGENKIDVVRNFISFKPEHKTITFEVLKKDVYEVKDAIITCKYNFQPEKKAVNNQIDFQGDELNEKWSVSVKVGDTLFSNIHVIDFEKDTDNPVKLILNDKSILTVIAKELEYPKNEIPNFKVWVQGKRYYDENVIEFIDDDIDKSFKIQVKCNGYLDSELQTYIPKEGNKTLHFYLKKENTQNQIDDIHFGGGLGTDGGKWYKNPKLIIVSILTVLILSTGIWGLRHYIGTHNPKKESCTADQINEYLRGDALILTQLNEFKLNWNDQNPKLNKEKDGFWFCPGNKNQIVEYNVWKQINDSIDSYISKRELINDMEFKKLKKVTFFYQKSFEQTIDDLDKSKYKLLEEKLDDISSLSLTEITLKIDSILNPVNKQEVNKPKDKGPTTPAPVSPRDAGKTPINKSGDKLKKPIGNNGQNEGASKGNNQNKGASVNDNEINSKVKSYLNSDEIKISKLEEYEKTTEGKLKTSIKTAISFWELDLTDIVAKKKYLNQIKDDDYLKHSKLKQFVEQIINKNEPIKKNKLSTLKNIIDESHKN